MDKSIWKELLNKTDELIGEAVHAHIDALKNANNETANKLNHALKASGEAFSKYAEDIGEREISFAESSAKLIEVTQTLETQTRELSNSMARINGNESLEASHANIDIEELKRRKDSLIEGVREKSELIEAFAHDFAENVLEINKRRGAQK